jgi:hypothetical protein
MAKRERRGFIPRDVVLMLLGLVGGGVLCDIYYRMSLHDSEASAAEQSRVNNLVLRGIESQGTINYVRDASGKVTGVNIQLRGSACDTTSATGTLTTGPAPSKK